MAYNKWKDMQNRSVWENCIIKQHDMIKGTRGDIERLLSISMGSGKVNRIMDKVDLIIEIATEMGIDLARCNFDRKIKTNLYRAREERVKQ